MVGCIYDICSCTAYTLFEVNNYVLNLQNPSQHLAVFCGNGGFATASVGKNRVTFWPQPVENGELMTKSNKAFECGGNVFWYVISSIMLLIKPACMYQCQL